MSNEYLDRIERALTIPAAEYVPAISDVFNIIDEARRRLAAEPAERYVGTAPEPTAWVVYAPNGNVVLWSRQQHEANKCAEARGLQVTPLYAHPPPGVPVSGCLLPAEKTTSAGVKEDQRG